MTDYLELVERLRKRATMARREGDCTAKADADHFDEAASAIEILIEEKQQWQPIETAPKDE